MAVDNAGRALVGLDPRPAVSAASAGQIGPTEATLSGTVAANDASPLSCQVEYGTTAGYGHVGALLEHTGRQRRRSSR